MGTLEGWRKGKLESREDSCTGFWRAKLERPLWRGRAFELADSHVDICYCIVAMTALYGRSQSHERMGYCIQHFIRLGHPRYSAVRHLNEGTTPRAALGQLEGTQVIALMPFSMTSSTSLTASLNEVLKEHIYIDIPTLNADIYKTKHSQCGKGWEGRNNPRHCPRYLQPSWSSSSPISTLQTKKPNPH